MSKSKNRLLRKIIKLEFEMFENVRAIQPSLCQEKPGSFRLMREMNHSVLSNDTLKSYLKDLKTARLKGRNLMTEKYARINNIIHPINLNPDIQKIVSTELEWFKEFSEQYPYIINKKPNYFSKYLSCELETYSNRSIELYIKDIEIAQKVGINLVKQRFKYLVKKLGYTSLDEFESKRKE